MLEYPTIRDGCIHDLAALFTIVVDSPSVNDFNAVVGEGDKVTSSASSIFMSSSKHFIVTEVVSDVLELRPSSICQIPSTGLLFGVVDLSQVVDSLVSTTGWMNSLKAMLKFLTWLPKTFEAVPEKWPLLDDRGRFLCDARALLNQLQICWYVIFDVCFRKLLPFKTCM